MKRKMAFLLMSVLMLLSISAVPVSAAQAKVTVKVDGKTVKFPDAQPYTEGSRVMIPVRFVSESLGAKVKYNKTTSGSRVKRIVNIQLDGKKIEMEVNSDAVLVDSKIVKLDVPARMQQDRVFVPIRFVSEALGADVKWNQSQKLVTITTKKDSTKPTQPEKPSAGKYGDFTFQQSMTDLAKSLFVNNMVVKNGKLTFTVPQGSTADMWTKDMKKTVLTPGKTYTFALGKDQGMISFNLVYPGKSAQEGYGVFLDAKMNDDLAIKFGGVTGDAIVAGDDNGATTLTNVINAAKKLK
ncbi:copper amine oxidase N-terminal domain-containing protein [Paenibacillus solani]|uniref:copper amine oxidase N-terminal domain-containing protein n=1 Tax=Paenibacillus solani TaxID=1705565 RepID=UPI003D2783E6